MANSLLSRLVVYSPILSSVAFDYAGFLGTHVDDPCLAGSAPNLSLTQIGQWPERLSVLYNSTVIY